MRRFKSIIRIFFLSIAIILAVAGIGIGGAMIPVYRERFMNNEIRIEMVDKKKTKKDESLKIKD